MTDTIYLVGKSEYQHDAGYYTEAELDEDQGYFTDQEAADVYVASLNAPLQARYQQALDRYHQAEADWEEKDRQARLLGFRAERPYWSYPSNPTRYEVIEVMPHAAPKEDDRG